jgi:hypothetical protein
LWDTSTSHSHEELPVSVLQLDKLFATGNNVGEWNTRMMNDQLSGAWLLVGHDLDGH